MIYPTGNCINPVGENVEINARYAIDIWKEKIGGSTITTNATSSTKSRNDNKSVVFGVLNDLLSRNLLDIQMVRNLADHDFTLQNFGISKFPFLVRNSGFDQTGFPSSKFYRKSATITIDGEAYRVCSQWGQKNIEKLKQWHESL